MHGEENRVFAAAHILSDWPGCESSCGASCCSTGVVCCRPPNGALGPSAVADAMAHTSLRIEELAVGKEPAPDEVVDNAEQSLLVAEAIEKLPEDYRRVIELRHFHGHSHASVAAEIGRSAAATRMLWVRALVELRRIVNET